MSPKHAPCHALHRRLLSLVLPWLIASALLWLPPPVQAAPRITSSSEVRNVLLLHSYHKGFSWTDSVDGGIGSVLGAFGDKIRLYTEYMDTKRFFDDAWLERLRALYAVKYKDISFDVIVCSDDNAYHFLLDHQAELFPACPVVFCGVNAYSPGDLGGHELFTGVVEVVDIRSTLNAALALHPATRRVYVLVDRTPTGVGTRDVLARLMPDFAGRLWFTFLDDLPMEEVLRRTRLFEKESILLLLNYNRDGAGHIYSHEETIDLLAANCQIPIYGQWDFHLGRGIVGGKLATGRVQGEMAARLAVRVLHGERPRDIPVITTGANRFLFDYAQMQRFGIAEASLPAGSQLVNTPRSLYEVNKTLIWSVAALLAFLVLALVGLSLHVVQRRRAERILVRMNRALSTLSQCNQCLIRAGSEEELLSEICRVIVESGGYQLSWVGYVLPGSTSVWPQASWDAQSDGAAPHLDWCNVELDAGPTGWAYDADTPSVVHDMEADPLYQRWREQARSRGYAATIALPLKEGGAIFGILRIYSSVCGDFDDDEVALLSALADNLAYGIGAQRLTLERKNALEALGRSKEQLSMLLESLPIVPFTCAGGEPLRITFVGSAVEDVTGYRASCFTDVPGFWRERLHPDDMQEVLAVFGAPEADRTVQHRYRFRIADGTFRWFSDTRRLNMAQDDGEPRITATWQDVTEDQRLRDEADYRRRQVIHADKLASLGEVVAGVAHEINNPNAFISYNIPLLQETWEVFRPLMRAQALADASWHRNGLSLEDYCQDMDGIIGDIASGASRITGVVSSLKEFARDNGPQAPAMLDINEIVRKAMVIVGAQVRKRFPSHALDLADGVPRISGQPLELEQVVANLLVNATHAVRDEPGKLALRSRYLERLNCVALEIEDNGGGMTQDILGQVFKPFYTTRRESGGTGLGLSVSYLIVGEHDGVFCVLSRPGGGTRFSVLLPAPSAPRPTVRPTVVLCAVAPSLVQQIATGLDEYGWSVKSTPDMAGLEGLLADTPEAFAVVVGANALSTDALAAFRKRFPLPLALGLGIGGDMPPLLDGALTAAFTTSEMLAHLTRVSQVII